MLKASSAEFSHFTGFPQDSVRIVDYAVQFVRDLNKMEAWKANSEIREMGEISD